MQNKVTIGQKSKVNIKWNVLPIDRTKEAEEEIRSSFAKKYGIPKDNITVEPNFIIKNEEGEISDIYESIGTNIQDPIYQQSLFKPYLDEREVKDYDLESILEIDKLINSKINYDLYESHKRYTIKWIKWSNFMSYGSDNFFDFSNLKGLVLLKSEPANQGGKTTFCLDLFRFLLYGKITSRENDWVLSKLFNKHIPEATDVTVEGCINIDGQDYVIKRVVSRPSLSKRTAKSKVSQKVSYFKYVEDNYIDLEDYDGDNENGQDGRETNKIIKETIGNEKDFDLMICVDSDNLKGLISLKDTDRGRLIARWIGLLPLEEKEKNAREMYNHKIVPSLMMNRFDKDDLNNSITELTNSNESLKKETETALQEKKKSEKKVDKLNKEREKLLESKQKIDETLTKVDVHTIEVKLSDIKEKGTIKREEKKRNEELLSEFSDVNYDENEYQELIQKDKDNAVLLANTENDYKQVTNDITALKKGEFCPTCGARLKNVDNSDAISKKQEKLQEIIELGKKYRALSLEYSEKKCIIENRRSDFNKKSKIELMIATNEVDINKLLNEYRENSQILKDIEKNKTAIEKNNEIDLALNANAENIKVENRIITEKTNLISSNTTLIEQNKKSIKSMSETLNKISEEEKTVKNWLIYLDIIGKNGISKLVLRKTLPLINGELHRILNGVCDFDVEVRIDNDNSVSFYMIHDGIESSLGSGSGFEKTVSSLALRSVLSKISTFSKPSFVVFDEILGGVADENYDCVKSLYDKIVKDFDCIIQISHISQIADWHDKVITVIKENNISKIREE